MSKQSPRGSIPKASVRASLANGFQVFSDDVIPLLMLGFLVVVVGTACRALIVVGESGPLISLGTYMLIAGPLELGLSFVCLRAVRSGQVNLEHLLGVFSRYWPLVIANALMAMILPGLLAILVLPGLAFFFATRFVPFLVLEDELSGAEAILESIRLSRSCFWQLGGICVVGILATMLGGISIIGLVPALLWWNLSLASLYHSVVRPPQGWAIEDEEALELRRTSEE